eukprot:gene7008-7077_t
MLNFLAPLLQPALLGLEPETAHRATITALKIMPRQNPPADDPRLGVDAFGLHFANPLGMAAGFDKNAEVPDALLSLGFGFTEIGSITPKPQSGNAKPRVFRLREELGLINRLGFNNEGHDAALHRLKARAQHGREKHGIVGVNLGANKDSADRIADYVLGIQRFAGVASYFTINVSSPNTPGLRDLQGAQALDDLLARVLDARDMMSTTMGRRPVLLKIAPDLALEDLDDAVRIARQRCIDGMIVSNTTISRPNGLRGPIAETGGLSGKPLFKLATQMLAQTYLRVERQFPLIGVGGIHDGASAYDKITAGASLLQFYSALVFKGLPLIGDIKTGLLQGLARDGHADIAAATGTKATDWAAK